MSKQTINIGTTANDGTGDPLRTAFDKANDNYNELYNALGGSDVTRVVNNGELDLTVLGDDLDLNGNAILGNALFKNNVSLQNGSNPISIVLNATTGNIDANGLNGLTYPTVDGSAGQALTTDGSGNLTFTTISGGGGASAIDDLSDVNITSPSNGQVLKWDGSEWVNAADSTASSSSSTFLSLSDTPVSFGTAGQTLVVNSGGDGLEFTDASGGGSSLQTRTVASATTTSIADGAQQNANITGFKSYALLSITTDRAARVILYANDASRLADGSRNELTDPSPNAGVIAEVITTGAETVLFAPGVIGFNAESTPTTTIPARIYNKSGSTSTVEVDLSILQLEA